MNLSRNDLAPGEPLPGHGPCFVCGTENPRGLGLIWYEAERRIVSEFTLGIGEQGPPGHAHGGISAAIIDEAMGKAVWRAGLQALLANMNVDYLRPAPLGMRLRVEAWLDHVEGRRAYAGGHLLLDDGSPAVRATGLYVDAPGFFAGRRTYDRDWGGA